MRKHGSKELTRRDVLALAGAAGIALATAALEPASAAAFTDPTAKPTPEGEVGPYFADDSAHGFHRRNVLTNVDGTATQLGIPLTLTVYVYDSHNKFAPLHGCHVDIWHCNALGVYSDEDVENTSGVNWLRGYQLTDSSGAVTFKTILPGWYQGRTTHIHLRVRSKYNDATSHDDGTNTTQIFFAQKLLDDISTNVAPYSANGINPTTNVSDHVYSGETAGETQVALTGNYAAGFKATFAVNLPIAAPVGGPDGPSGPGGPDGFGGAPPNLF